MEPSAKAHSPLLQLPLELRRHIYSYLLTPDRLPDIAVNNIAHRSVAYVCDYHEYEPSGPFPPTNVLHFHNSPLNSRMILRTKYKVRSGRLRSACEDASYVCSNKTDLSTSVFGVSRQIHDEAVGFLYGSYIFDFDTHVESCVPFLADLTPYARSCIRRISIVKRALPYDKDFDRCEWSYMCDYLSREMKLKELLLGVVAGKPAAGWDDIQIFNKCNIAGIVRSMDEMSWVNEVAGIGDLEKISVRACIEHSPPPMSSMMAFFVAFSASVEPHFAEYLTSRMITAAG